VAVSARRLVGVSGQRRAANLNALK